MAAELLTDASRATDSNSNPYAGAQWYFYASGTLTPQNVYANAALSVSLGAVVTADAGGKFVPIYLDATKQYRGILKDATGAVTVYDIDPISNSVLYQLANEGLELILTDNGTLGEKLSRDLLGAMDYAGAGVGTPSADTVAWQSLLAAGGSIFAPEATYLTTEAQVVESQTTLRMRDRSQLRQSSGANSNVFTNAAYLAPWVDVSGNVTWVTNEYEAQVTVPGGLVAIGNPGIGDAVWLDGAAQPQYNGVFDVTEVVNSSNIKVRLKRVPLANPTGTLRIKKADKDIVIDARGAAFDYNETNNSDSTPGPQTHTIVLGGIRNLHIIGPNFLDTKKFAICLVAVSQFHVEGAQGWGMASDMLKLYGPIWDGVVENIRGTPGDDFVSIQPHEPTAFAAYQIGAGGDCLDITVRGLQCQGSASPIVSLYPSAYGLIDNIVIDDVTGYTTLPAIQVYDYDGGSSMGEVKISRLNCIAQRALNVQAATGTVTVKHIDLEIGPRFRNKTGADIINWTASATIDCLTLRTDINTTEIGAGALINCVGNGRIINFENCRYKVNAAYLFAGTGGASLEQVNFKNCDIDVTGEMFRGHAATFTQNPVISFNGGKYKGTAIVTLASTATLNFNGARLHPSTFVLVGSGASASDTNMSSNGCRLATGGWASMSGSAAVSPRSTDIILNLNDTRITRKTGNFMQTNTQTGAGGTDIRAGALVVCQGTSAGSWKEMTDLTRSF